MAFAFESTADAANAAQQSVSGALEITRWNSNDFGSDGQRGMVLIVPGSLCASRLPAARVGTHQENERACALPQLFPRIFAGLPKIAADIDDHVGVA